MYDPNHCYHLGVSPRQLPQLNGKTYESPEWFDWSLPATKFHAPYFIPHNGGCWGFTKAILWYIDNTADCNEWTEEDVEITVRKKSNLLPQKSIHHHSHSHFAIEVAWSRSNFIIITQVCSLFFERKKYPDNFPQSSVFPELLIMEQAELFVYVRCAPALVWHTHLVFFVGRAIDKRYFNYVCLHFLNFPALFSAFTHSKTRSSSSVTKCSKLQHCQNKPPYFIWSGTFCRPIGLALGVTCAWRFLKNIHFSTLMTMLRDFYLGHFALQVEQT